MMSTPLDRRAPVTVLLVDDDPASATVLAPRLADTCGRLIEVGDAERALDACAQSGVDLVVTSARLGGIGAQALCAELRRVGGPPVIAYRVGADPDAHIGWLRAGGADGMSGDDPVLLAARCRALLRRTWPPRPPSPWQHHVGL